MTTTAIDLAPTRPAPAWRAPVSMLGHQLRYDLKVMFRNRQARFFTLALPVLMLVLFSAIFGKGTFGAAPHQVSGTTYYLANQIGFGTVDAAFMSLAIYLVVSRETGVLKRRRATPQPAWVIVASRALAGVVTTLLLTAVLLLVGRIAYSASIPLHALPALIVTSLVATFAFCAVGFAASGLISSTDSAQPAVMGVALPLFFISGVFVPWPVIPPWLRSVAQVFPVRHLAEAVLVPLTSTGSGFRPGDLAVIAAWGLAALVLATRRFAWAPRTA